MEIVNSLNSHQRQGTGIPIEYINPNELRLGNWIKTNIYQQVTLETFEFLLNDNFKDRSIIKPIPLTKEILEAAGFEKDRNGLYLPNTYFSLTDKFYPCWLDKMLWPQDLQQFKDKQLKYLHRLQNLVFSLTEIGLEIDITKIK